MRIPVAAGVVFFVCLLLIVPSGLLVPTAPSVGENPPLGVVEVHVGSSTVPLSAPAAASPTFFGNWTRPNGNPPSSYSSAIVYDAADGYALSYGGGIPSAYPFQPSTTWEYVNGTWTPHDLSPSPSVVTGAGMAFDARDGYVVLFGGANSNATWTFSRGSWTEIFPRHSPIPGAGSDMIYDPASRSVILYAGHHTWSFSAGQWTDDTHYTKYTGPPTLPAGESALAYDSHDHYAVSGPAGPVAAEAGTPRGRSRAATGRTSPRRREQLQRLDPMPRSSTTPPTASTCCSGGAVQSRP